MRDVKVSLVGYGIVGHGVVDVLNRKKKILRDMGLNLLLISVSDHTGTIVSEDGVDADMILGDRTLANVATSSMKGKEAIEAIGCSIMLKRAFSMFIFFVLRSGSGSPGFYFAGLPADAS